MICLKCFLLTVSRLLPDRRVRKRMTVFASWFTELNDL